MQTDIFANITNGLAYVPHSATVLSGELACAVDWEASQGGVRRYNERGALRYRTAGGATGRPLCGLQDGRSPVDGRSLAERAVVEDWREDILAPSPAGRNNRSSECEIRNLIESYFN